MHAEKIQRLPGSRESERTRTGIFDTICESHIARSIHRGAWILRIIPITLALVLTPACLAQNTCFTNPHGTTICSSPGTVVHGSTNSTGQSLYRDDRGNQLDFHTDQFGNASVELPSGEAIRWSQPVLGEKKYPEAAKPPASQVPTLTPGLPGDRIMPPSSISQGRP